MLHIQMITRAMIMIIMIMLGMIHNKLKVHYGSIFISIYELLSAINNTFTILCSFGNIPI